MKIKNLIYWLLVIGYWLLVFCTITACNLSSTTEEENTYTITYDSNFELDTVNEQTFTAATATDITLDTNSFSFTGYTFLSWNTSDDGTGTSYSDGETVTISAADITLYAQWEEMFVTTWTIDDNTLYFPLYSGGTYDFIIDWGDGSSETITETPNEYISHTYESNGDYTVSVTGTCEGFGFNTSAETYPGSLTDVIHWGNVRLHSNGYQFLYCSDLAGFTADDILYTSNMTNMNYMFCYATSFNHDISGWDTSAVTTMYYMFRSAKAFNQDISGWDTSAVTTMSKMFYYASDFNGNISGWDTSAVTSMIYMFYYASDFNGDISGWDTSAVSSINSMFSGASSFNHDISGWDTSAVTDMSYMFQYAYDFNQDISGWDTSTVATMRYMFNSASVFNQDISKWDTSAVTDMSSMFSGSGLDGSEPDWYTAFISD